MTSTGDHPRHSYPGPQTNSAARPRRAYTPEDIQPSSQSRLTPTPLPAVPPQEPLSPPPPDPAEGRRRTLWIVVAIILVIGIGGAVIANLPPQTTDPGRIPSQTATPPPRSGGKGFTTGTGATGYWKITNTQWNDTGVRLSIEITADTGTLYCAFSALDAGGGPLQPSYAVASDLRPGFVAAGETVVGTLTFDIQRQAMTLVMSDKQLVQVSALTVPG